MAKRNNTWTVTFRGTTTTFNDPWAALDYENELMEKELAKFKAAKAAGNPFIPRMPHTESAKTSALNQMF